MSIGLLVKAFGPAGVASCIAWAASLAVLVICVRSVRRHSRWKTALALGFVGWILARTASDRVSSIEVDRSEELEAARLYQKKLREEMEGFAFRQVRFAEDTERDRLDLAGLKRDELGTVTGSLGNAETSIPTYMAGGRQQRTAGKKKQIAAASLAKEETTGGLRMKEPDVLAANRFDRYNLFASDIALLAALCAVLWDYARRFNRTVGASMPLPISSPLLQAVSPPARTVLWRDAGREKLREYVEALVRKGETFAWFGPSPWHGSIPRSLPRFAFRNIMAGQHLILVFGSEDLPKDAEFFFDAIWFTRYAVLVTDPCAACALLEEWTKTCRRRRAKRARMRKMAHVIWAFDNPLPASLLAEMADLAEPLNFKLIVAVPPGSVAETSSAFAEII